MVITDHSDQWVNQRGLWETKYYPMIPLMVVRLTQTTAA